MRLHYFQHEPFEGLGVIEDWAKVKGFDITRTCFWKEDCKIPEIEEIDWLIVMGGPMSANDEDKLPWLMPEKEFIKKAIEAKKKVLGICLGAQMIAKALGAKVSRNEEKEIGWMPVSITEEAMLNPLFSGIRETMYVLHWHGETFSMPEKAIHAAFSAACVNQAFVFDNRVVGLQFHFEMKKENVEDIIEACMEEINEGGKYVQSVKQLNEGMGFIEENNRMMFMLLDNMLK